MSKTTVDLITVATGWHSMQTICRDMRHIVDRTSQNSLIGQLHDVSVGIWAATGTTIAVPVGLPVQFLGTHFAVKSLVEKFGNNLGPGDLIPNNDPYHRRHNCQLPERGFFP